MWNLRLKAWQVVLWVVATAVVVIGVMAAAGSAKALAIVAKVVMWFALGLLAWGYGAQSKPLLAWAASNDAGFLASGVVAAGSLSGDFGFPVDHEDARMWYLISWSDGSSAAMIDISILSYHSYLFQENDEFISLAKDQPEYLIERCLNTFERWSHEGKVPMKIDREGYLKRLKSE